jgi:hypothetical protein
MSLLRLLELSVAVHGEVFTRSVELGIEFMSTPFDRGYLPEVISPSNRQYGQNHLWSHLRVRLIQQAAAVEIDVEDMAAV